MTIKLIVGLGNPGAEYEATRHNAGVWFIQALANAYNLQFKAEKAYFGFTARGQIDGNDVRLLIPTTFMNLSGKAVQALSNFYKIEVEEILVAYDELDLPPGAAKLKKDGGHGGHNGLKSIIQSLGNRKDFHRLRLGIGHPGSKHLVTAHVLSKPSISDRKLIDNCIEDSLAVINKIIQGEWAEAMNQLHRRSS